MAELLALDNMASFLDTTAELGVKVETIPGI